jgi:hypothetical protein
MVLGAPALAERGVGEGGGGVRAALALLAALALAACDIAYDRRIDGPYKLLAIDGIENTSVVYALDHNSSIGRIGPTVFAVGHDTDYIVAARHRYKRPFGPTSSITEYFYVIRAEDGRYKDDDAVRGPFTYEEFAAEKARLALPEFTHEIARLKQD